MKDTLQVFKAVASAMIGVGKKKILLRTLRPRKRMNLGLILLSALL